MLVTNTARNLLLMATLALTSVMTVAQTATEVTPDTVKVLSKADVDAFLASPDQVLIIDVRRPDELTSIGGFPAYLSIQSNALESSLAWIPSNRAIVTVSNHAGRAKRAAALLSNNGFDVLGAVGAQDFEAEGGVLTKIAPPANEP
ncbi:MAG: rhodanese-like domain-containing protein [Pseudomonadota bacterium]